MCTNTRYLMLVDKIKQRYPDVKIRYKGDHWLWKRLPKIFRESACTLGNTIWMPKQDFEMLAHEYQHIADIHDIGIIGFLIMYLSPQVVVPFWILMGVLSMCLGLPAIALIAAIAGLLFMLPWPSKKRAFLELRGYMTSIHIHGYDRSKDFVVDSITSWLYYKMVWSRITARRMLDDFIHDQNNSIACSVVLRDIDEILENTSGTTLVCND